MESKLLSEIYDRFAEKYEKNRNLFNIDQVISDFQAKLPTETGKLLDLGCGAGEPLARSFIDNGWQVAGVDFSQKMLALASTNNPTMETIHADICDVNFAEKQFDAVTAIYSLFHVPRKKHFELFRKIYGWLKPSGLLLFTYATAEYTGSNEFDGYKEFMGERLYYSHDEPDNLYRLLENVGFIIESRQKHSIAGETFLWITASK